MALLMLGTVDAQPLRYAQRYNYSHSGKKVTFTVPGETELEVDEEGFIEINVRWANGMMANTTKLVIYASSCSGVMGFIGLGDNCRPCPTGAFCMSNPQTTCACACT